MTEAQLEKQKYTMAILPEEKTMAELQTVINDLAAQYGTVIFEPHLTFVGSLELASETVLAVAEEIAPSLQALELRFLSVEYSTTYWRCIYGLVKSEPRLMAAHQQARQKLGQTGDYFGFIPHISLMYANFEMEKLDLICRAIQLQNMHWRAGSLIVYEDSSDPAKWRHLAKFDLGS